MVFLSFVHFICTSIGCRVLLFFGFFKYKPAPLAGVLPVAIGSLLSVAFMNLNLAYNSVGFYQLSKLACIPFTIVVQYGLYRTTVSKTIQLALIPLTVGVGIATVYDVEVNLTGTLFALFAVIATGMAQIFTNTYQQSLNCNALQLLYHTSPIISLGMLLLCPMFDNLPDLLRFRLDIQTLIHIAFSCICAFGVNITNYTVLGRTSPLTYQVIGHLKTILILIIGFALFKYEIDGYNLAGITLAMIGVIAYTEIKRRETRKVV